jgi:hypothetical protein
MDNRSPEGESYADSTATFPQKLFAMMEIEDGDVVHWAPHGFAFVVTNQDKFLNEIVPKYFKRKCRATRNPALQVRTFPNT